MTSIADQKTAARRSAKTARQTAHDRGGKNGAPLGLIKHFPAAKFKGAVIAGYHPIGDEIDPRPLLTALSAHGHKLCLPCTPQNGQPLTFRSWHPDDTLREGRFGTAEPAPDQPIITPTLILLPLLAFTKTGERLGYGGGFYDRTLAALRAENAVFACGLAYSSQLKETLPTDQYDQKLDGVVTEQSFRTFI